MLVEMHDLFEPEVLPRECLVIVRLSLDSFMVVNKIMCFDSKQY